MIVPLLLGAAAGTLAYATYRASRAMPHVGDEVFVPPSALAPDRLLPLGTLVDVSKTAFVIVKVTAIPSATTVQGNITGAQGVPVLQPIIGPVTVDRAAVTRVVRDGEVVGP